MDLQANTEQVVAFIERVADNPSTACKRCSKWHNDIGILYGEMKWLLK